MLEQLEGFGMGTDDIIQLEQKQAELEALVQELTAIAQISASNSTAAIIFDDKAAAHETLTALSVRPNIESAAISTLPVSLETADSTAISSATTIGMNISSQRVMVRSTGNPRANSRPR